LIPSLYVPPQNNTEEHMLFGIFTHSYEAVPWQFLNFLPLPHGQSSLRPTSMSLRTGAFFFFGAGPSSFGLTACPFATSSRSRLLRISAFMEYFATSS